MFLDSLDIANRGCQILGVERIQNVNEDSKQNAEMSFVYDKLRREELRRNVWGFAIRNAVLRPLDTTTFLLAPAQWNAGTQYLPGSVVADANGQLWISNQANNINNPPGLSNVWDGYFGSMTADAFDTTGATAYYSGDIVYIRNADSSYILYMSLQNANTETPNVADVWSATNTYQQDDMVSFSGQMWRSLIALNTNNSPVAGPQNWVATQTYGIGNQVTGTDGFIYTSVGNNNLGNNPVTDTGTNWTNTDIPNAWTLVPAMPTCSSLWTPLYASLVSFNFVYPIGYGPASQQTTKNIFRLPAGYLRRAPQDPKAGRYAFLGAPAYNTDEDWNIQGKYLLSQLDGLILLRFVADVMKVTDMDDMFCEGLACRMADATCETLTNSKEKQGTANSMYLKFMGEARIVNSIETGPVQPPEDDYIACRL